MAGRRGSKADTNKTDNENTTPESTTLSDEEMFDMPDANETPEVNENPVPEVTGDADETNNTNADQEDNVTTKEPETFDLPANPEDLVLSDSFAQTFGVRLLDFLGQIKEIDEELRAAEEGNTEAAVVAYAESDKASEDVQSVYGSYSSLKAQLNELMSQLSALVQSEKGEVKFTDEEIAEKKELRKSHVTTVRNALVSFEMMTANNKSGPDVRLFQDTIKRIIGGRGSRAGTTPTSGKAPTEIRPRLGGKTGGYVKVGEAEFKSFTPALNELQIRAKNKSITVTELHVAWANAAGMASENEWAQIPKGTTVSFELYGVPIEVHTEYDGGKKPVAA